MNTEQLSDNELIQATLKLVDELKILMEDKQKNILQQFKEMFIKNNTNVKWKELASNLQILSRRTLSKENILIKINIDSEVVNLKQKSIDTVVENV